MPSACWHAPTQETRYDTPAAIIMHDASPWPGKPASLAPSTKHKENNNTKTTTTKKKRLM